MNKKCNHRWNFISNVYGDEVNRIGERMKFVCSQCGAIKYSSPGWGTRWFVIDVESDGLYGSAIAVAVYVFTGGEIFASFEGRVPNTLVKNQWVRENVLPEIAGMTVTHQTSESLEEAFWKFWIDNRSDRTVVLAHMPFPVETGLFSCCVARDVESRQWLGPYPGILDVAWELKARGFTPDTVDDYIDRFGMMFPQEGRVHDPRYDAKASYSVYLDLLLRSK